MLGALRFAVYCRKQRTVARPTTAEPKVVADTNGAQLGTGQQDSFDKFGRGKLCKRCIKALLDDEIGTREQQQLSLTPCRQEQRRSTLG